MTAREDLRHILNTYSDRQEGEVLTREMLQEALDNIWNQVHDQRVNHVSYATHFVVSPEIMDDDLFAAISPNGVIGLEAFERAIHGGAPLTTPAGNAVV